MRCDRKDSRCLCRSPVICRQYPVRNHAEQRCTRDLCSNVQHSVRQINCSPSTLGDSCLKHERSRRPGTSKSIAGAVGDSRILFPEQITVNAINTALKAMLDHLQEQSWRTEGGVLFRWLREGRRRSVRCGRWPTMCRRWSGPCSGENRWR